MIKKIGKNVGKGIVYAGITSAGLITPMVVTDLVMGSTGLQTQVRELSEEYTSLQTEIETAYNTYHEQSYKISNKEYKVEAVANLTGEYEYRGNKLEVTTETLQQERNDKVAEYQGRVTEIEGRRDSLKQQIETREQKLEGLQEVSP